MKPKFKSADPSVTGWPFWAVVSLAASITAILYLVRLFIDLVKE
jgi:hypothetical protein